MKANTSKSQNLRCSRHFRKNNIEHTLAGKSVLKPDVIPSVFSWVHTSPRKRKLPKERPFVDIRIQNSNNSNNAAVLDVQEEAQESHNVVQEILIETRHVDVCTQMDMTAYKVRIAEIEANYNRKIKALEMEINKLNMENQATERILESLQSQVFSLKTIMAKKTNTSASFYTGFEN